MAASTVHELLGAMLNKPLYVALREPKDLTLLPVLLEAHLQWMIAAEQRGELFASGPFVEEGAAPGTSGGMTIVRADSVEDAQRILADDPFIRAGVFTARVRKWLLMEGSLTVTVRFSDRSARLL